MKKFCLALMATAFMPVLWGGSVKPGPLVFSRSEDVVMIFSYIDQALEKAFGDRTLIVEGLLPVAKMDFENTVTGALDVANRKKPRTATKEGLAKLTDQFTQLNIMINLLKGQRTKAAQAAFVNDIKAKQAEMALLEKNALNEALKTIQKDLEAKWDEQAKTLQQGQFLTPAQQTFLTLFVTQYAKERDLKPAEMDALLIQSGVTATSNKKHANGRAIESLMDAISRYSYLLKDGKITSVTFLDKKTLPAIQNIRSQLRNLYGLSMDESTLIGKVSLSLAILYKLSNMYNSLWTQLLRELGAA